jgi:hypothetical protein
MGTMITKCQPTDDMESDYLSKPLTGSKGNKHRSSMMNLASKQL